MRESRKNGVWHHMRGCHAWTIGWGIEEILFPIQQWWVTLLRATRSPSLQIPWSAEQAQAWWWWYFPWKDWLSGPAQCKRCEHEKTTKTKKATRRTWNLMSENYEEAVRKREWEAEKEGREAEGKKRSATTDTSGHTSEPKWEGRC